MLIAVILFSQLILVSKLKAQDGIDTGKAKIAITFFSEDSVKQVKATLTKTGADGKEIPIPEIDIHFYAQRDFGLLPLEGDNKTTDESGVAFIDFPTDLPGDSAGNVKVIARLEEDEVYGELADAKNINWGKKLIKEESSLRTMWASGINAPWSLVIVVTGMIVGVWFVILYVIIQMFKINKLGKL